jgi:hypothetical protein
LDARVLQKARGHWLWPQRKLPHVPQLHQSCVRPDSEQFSVPRAQIPPIKGFATFMVGALVAHLSIPLILAPPSGYASHFTVNSKKDDIFFGHQACRPNLAALLFGPCRTGCSSFERKAE